MGGSTKVEAIKDIIKSENPDILLIQETKILEAEIMALYQIMARILVPKEPQGE